MKIILEKELQELPKEQLTNVIQISFTGEDRKPLYLFLNDKERDAVSKNSPNDIVLQFLKEESYPFENIRIDCYIKK